jgi:hypothetical protein
MRVKVLLFLSLEATFDYVLYTSTKLEKTHYFDETTILE